MLPRTCLERQVISLSTVSCISVCIHFGSLSPGYYFRASGAGNVIFMILCTASSAAFSTFPQYWLKLWTDSGLSHTTSYIIGYVLLLLVAWLSTNGSRW